MKILTNILNPIDESTTEYLDNYVIEVEKHRIIRIYPIPAQAPKINIVDLRDRVLLPQLIDAHTHLPQLPIIGNFGLPLLDWLTQYTFPAEIEFAKEEYAKQLSKKFFNTLKRMGTGIAVVYSTIHANSTEIAFQEAEKSKLKIFMGKVMMNQNCPKELCENPIQSLNESYQLSNKWHKKGSLEYVYTPRFAISTSKELMYEIAKIAKVNSNFIQTHLNENLDEKKAIKKLYPECKNYTEVYQQAKILGSKTLLAHAIHNDKEELEIIKKTNSKVIHCPDANMFLGSGRFPLEKFIDMEIPVGLGSDVGAGTTLDMFEIMRSMIFVQNANMRSLASMERALFYATRANAQILEIDNDYGEICEDRVASFLSIKIPGKRTFKDSKDILSHVIFKKDFDRELLYY